MFNRLFGRRDEPAAEAEAPPDAQELPARNVEEGLAKTRKGLLDRLAEVFGAVDITDRTWDDLEAQLIQADVGVQTAVQMVTELRERARFAGVRRANELPGLLHAVMVRTLESTGAAADAPGNGFTAAAKPWIVLVVGVNGSGKTTTIAKLAAWHRRQGRAVVLVAADTFRAAAIEQLQAWGARAGVPVVAGQSGGDPGAVVFDALSSTAGSAADVVIIDTAGRLHTQFNLMAELTKVRSVVQRACPEGPHETLLVLDAMTGQNGLQQAKAFTSAVAVTDLGLAKLDSSAKGGVAFAVTRELKLPIRYVGTGERLEDFALFDPVAYVNGVLGDVGM